MKVKRVPVDDLRLLLKDAVHRGGRFVFDGDLAGTSMSPFIDNGDRITVEAVSAKRLAVGEVIVYANPDGKPVAHRLVKIETSPNGILLFAQGADTASRVEEVEESSVLGRVIGVNRPSQVRRLLRRGVRFFRTRIARRLTEAW